LLGKSIYVPTADLLGAIPNGITFLKNISKECYNKIKRQKMVKDQSFYRNTGQFYKSIATTTNLHAGYESKFTLGFTLDAATKSISGNNRKVSGTSLKIVSKNYELQFKPNCLYESDLQERVLNDFAALQTSISMPWYKDSWRDYDVFLQTHGSHVITAVTYGASINQHAFAKESSKYKTKDFTAKACLALAGDINTIMNLSLSACAGLTKKDVMNITNAEMTSTITVRGGTLETRSKLLYERTKELILKFLEEGKENPSPIEFKLTPVWQVLNGQKQVKKENPNRAAQAANMQYYYEGFLNFDCPYIPAGERGPIIQKFDHAEHSTPQHPVYQCSLAPPGCHSNEDCHHRFGLKCACYGKSCIRHKDVELSSGETKPTAAPYENKNDFLWQGCRWKVLGITCGCKDENKKRRVIFENLHLEKLSRHN
jgi:hypothetical protein